MDFEKYYIFISYRVFVFVGTFFFRVVMVRDVFVVLEYVFMRMELGWSFLFI